MKSISEWCFLSLFHGGYFGRAHLVYLQQEADRSLNIELQRIHRRGEPILGFRCGDRNPPPPDGLYCRLVPEHPSLRIYQLEEKDD